MKIEREKDIPAFKGKTWRERAALRREARERDRSLVWLQIVMPLMAVPILFVSGWLTRRSSSILLLVGVYAVLVFPVFFLFHAIFITPRIRKALETDPKRSA